MRCYKYCCAGQGRGAEVRESAIFVAGNGAERPGTGSQQNVVLGRPFLCGADGVEDTHTHTYWDNTT